MEAAFEFWNVASNCYEANFAHPMHRVDLFDTDTAIRLIKDYAPDMIIGGPPCQDFPLTNRRLP